MDIDANRENMLPAQFRITHPYRNHQGIGVDRDESSRHSGSSPGHIAGPFEQSCVTYARDGATLQVGRRRWHRPVAQEATMVRF